METRFAASPPDLALYALAQARATEVESACGRSCAGCPGPGVPDGCETRKRPLVVLDRRDWPMCPRGMLRVPAWQDLVSLYLSAQVSPLTGWPDAYPAWVVEGVTQLQTALKTEEARQLKLMSGAATKGGAPRGSGRRSARRA